MDADKPSVCTGQYCDYSGCALLARRDREQFGPSETHDQHRILRALVPTVRGEITAVQTL